MWFVYKRLGLNKVGRGGGGLIDNLREEGSKLLYFDAYLTMSCSGGLECIDARVLYVTYINDNDVSAAIVKYCN